MTVDYAAVQAKLNALGANPPLAVDGAYGPMTRAAVIAFQLSHGLEGDGAVGPLTLAALGLDSVGPVPSAATSWNSVAKVKGIERLPPSDLRALAAAAAWIGVPVDWLATAISFESNGTFSPSVQNAASKATGLIQFLPSTAKRLGTSVEALKAMTFAQQLEYVKKYFEGHRGKLSSMADLYLAIFYPAEIGKLGSDVIAYEGSAVYDQNSGFDRSKKGYITRDDVTSAIVGKLNAAMALGERILIPGAAVAAGVGLMAVALGAATWWLVTKGLA